MDKKSKRISKTLSYYLRHRPDKISIFVDEYGGWTDVRELLGKWNEFHLNLPLTLEELELVVEDSDNKRFSFNEDKTLIRANQGHSIPVQLGLDDVEPPDMLYHGTPTDKADIILIEGLKKMRRHDVHLSPTYLRAIEVGSRRSNRVTVFLIDALEMFNEGYRFQCTVNGVWLTNHVPVTYITGMLPVNI